MIPQAKTGLVPESSSRQVRPVFSWSRITRDCLYFLALAIILGVLWNFSLLLKAFDGRLINEIQQYQLVELKSKAEQLYPGISFIDVVSAKKLYDDKAANFVDARTSQEFESKHISGAISLPVRALLQGDIEPDKVLPEREAVLITYCDGGECDISLELSKELSERGYQNIFVLGEGWPGWEAAGYPMDK